MQPPSQLIISDDARDYFSVLITDTRETLDVIAYAISQASALDSRLHTSIYRQLLNAPARKITCRILIATHPPNSPHEANNTIAANDLMHHGWQVARATRSPLMHAKLIVSDRRRAIIGSHNLTRAGLETNRELSIITEDFNVVTPAISWFDLQYAIALTTTTTRAAAR